MDGKTLITVFVKPPVPGEVKTRLIPALGADGAAALAQAFLEDTWTQVRSLPWAIPVIASTAPLSTAGLAGPCEVWLQGVGDLGARLERIFTAALLKADRVIAIGADTPGLPSRFLERACAEMLHGDAVLGPAEDGGFYLLGLRRCPPRLFDAINWSQSDTFASTVKRLRNAGLAFSLIDSWFDVDTPDDLLKLRRMIRNGEITAPRTAQFLNEHRIGTLVEASG